MKIKVGETIGDGWQVYMLANDKKYHHINSGRRAAYIVSTAKMNNILKGAKND